MIALGHSYIPIITLLQGGGPPNCRDMYVHVCIYRHISTYDSCQQKVTPSIDPKYTAIHILGIRPINPISTFYFLLAYEPLSKLLASSLIIL